MRKRSSSESGRRATISTPLKKVPSISKSHRSRYPSGKREDCNKKRKQSSDNTSHNKTESHSFDEQLPSGSVHSCDTVGTSRVLRKDSNLLLIEDKKKDPLPDILHDWEIIINSLKETNNSTDPDKENKISTDDKKDTITSVKCSSKKISKKGEKSEAEREISPKIKITEESIADKVGFSTPALKTKAAKQSSSEKKDTNQPESTVWRRPTRSTYKAFEDVLDSDILVDPPIITTAISLNQSPETLIDPTQKLQPTENRLKMKATPIKKISKDSPLKQNMKTAMNILKSEKYKTVNGSSPVKRRSSNSKKKLSQECSVKLVKLEQPLNGGDEDELDFLGFSSDLTEDKKNTIRNMRALKCAIRTDGVEATSSPKSVASNTQRSIVSSNPKFITYSTPKYIASSSPNSIASSTPKSIASSTPRSIASSTPKSIASSTPKKHMVHTLDEELESKQNVVDCCIIQSTDESIESDNSYNAGFEDNMFEEYFESEDSNLTDFEGFERDCYQFVCRKCSLTYPDSAALFHHRTYAHKFAHSCPFDVGNCGKFVGAVQLSSHLFEMHHKLVGTVINNIKQDVLNNTIAGWNNEKENCSICLYPMSQPNLSIHEMFVHAIWPSSVLCLKPKRIADIFVVFWTGKMLAFSCKFCKKISQEGMSSQYFLCSPSSFVTALISHARDLHKISVSYIQAWWLFYQLIICLPIETRRTLSSLLSLGEKVHGHCLICKVELMFSQKIHLNLSRALCFSCEEKYRCNYMCWFDCRQSFTDSDVMLKHFIKQHEMDLPEGWCIKCSRYCQNLIYHAINCRKYSKVCQFCKLNIFGFDNVKKIYHSLKFHSFICPVTDCQMPFHENGVKYHSIFPVYFALYKHLTVKHLPDFSSIGLQQMPIFLETVLGRRGNILDAGFSVNLNSTDGIWYGTDNYKYKFVNGVLEFEETVTVALLCTLCKSKWDCIICRFGPTNNVRTVCPVCIIALKQCSNGDVMHQCPSTNCLQAINSSSQLNEHLTLAHSFSLKQQQPFTCSFCLFVFNSALVLSLHHKIKHEIPCLFCSFVAVTEKQVNTHRLHVHRIPNWYSIYIYFQKRNKLNSPPSKASSLGVVRVWSENDSVKAQYDRTINISGTNIPLPEKVCAPLSIKKSIDIDAPKSAAHSNDTYNWCSSLCKVSMSPSKPSVDKELNEEAANIMKRITNYDEDSNGDIALPSNLLIPNITISEDVPQNLYKSSSPSSSKITESSKMAENKTEAENLCNVKELNGNELTIKTNGIESNSSSSASSPLFIGFDSSKAISTVGEYPSSKYSLHTNHTEKTRKKVIPVRVGRPKTGGRSHSKKGETKGLGENAFINEDEMAINILTDLQDKFQGTCVDCGYIISLLELSVHASQVHSNKLFQCQCGYVGELNTYLVHTFHMSHQPCEARPIIMYEKASGSQSLVVLEERPITKQKSFPCYKCNKRFKQEKSRQLHYNLCKLEKKYQCEQCFEKFAMENHLTKHKEWKHNPQACQHCGKEFNSSSSLTQHVLHIHRKQLNYKCKLCNDSFHTASQLKVHQRIHSGEQPHSCPSCSFTFISKNLLKKHINCEHCSSSDDETPGLTIDIPISRRRKYSRSSRASKQKVQQNIIALTHSDLETDLSDSENESMKIKNTNQQKNVLKMSSLTASEMSTPKADVTTNIDQALPKLRENIRDKLSIGKICFPCGEEFYSVAGKLLHMYLIHPNSVMSQASINQCGFCDYTFTSADDITDHHIDEHQRSFLPNGNFKCLCGLVFREEGAYYFHLYYAHRAQRALNVGGEIICRVCEGRSTLNKIVDLAVHLSDRHTMFDHVRYNDSYMCNFCHKAFESWTVLSLHFFMVHKATKSQTLSYDCPYCEGASPWHSLEALQYHLDNVHRGRHTKSQPVLQLPDNIYTPAPGSPKKRKDPLVPSIKFKRQKISKGGQLTIENDKSLYCICQCPYDEVSDMIGCDSIDCKYQWFHFECVGIMAAPEGNWFCPDCTLFQQKNRPRNDNVSQSYRTPIYKVATSSDLDVTREVHNSSISSSSSSSSGSSSSSSSGSSSSDSSTDSE